MKTRNWLWLLLAAMVCMFGACDDNSPSTPPEWAVNGGSISLTPSGHELSRDEAWELVKEMVLCDNLKDIAVRSYKDIIEPNDSILLGFTVKIPTPNYRSWFFFIEESYENMVFLGAHKCRYVFVAIDGSAIEVQYRASGTEPEDLGEYDNIVKAKTNNKVKDAKIAKSRSTSSIIKNEISAAHNYAIIINGGKNKEKNYICFWNSCNTIYNTLVQQYGYLKPNIKVLMADGNDPAADRNTNDDGTFDSSPTDLDGDGVSDITSSATASDVQAAFADLASTLTSDDELIVFINSHGGADIYNNCATTLWDGGLLYDFTLNSYLNQISAKNIHVIIAACHSGGFIDVLSAENRTITTSCSIDEMLSFEWSDSYDDFSLYWLSAIMSYSLDEDRTINPDTNYDGIVSYSEAYYYAYNEALDRRGKHAQYSSIPTSLGLTRGLKPESLYAINGDSRFCSQAVYNIPELPSGANVEWNVTYSEKNPNNDSQLSHSSFTSTGSTLTLSRTAPATYNIGTRITYNGLTEDISKKASCGACSPYNGIMYWESDLLNGSVQFNSNTGGPEFEVDVAQDFVVTSYVDFAGNVIVPTIDYILSPDITQDDCSGNTSSLTFGFSGEGEMEVYLLNDCGNNGTEYSFIVPYIVFDPNSYSLQLDESTSTLNVASQTTTYGLRNENPIRTIEVRTYDRQTLLTFNVEDDQTNVADIDVSTLSPGTYILKVTDDTVHYLKLVI